MKIAKELAWQWIIVTRNGREYCQGWSETETLMYEIEETGKVFETWIRAISRTVGSYNTLQEAKQACQDHYEQLVRSQLTSEALLLLGGHRSHKDAIKTP